MLVLIPLFIFKYKIKGINLGIKYFANIDKVFCNDI